MITTAIGIGAVALLFVIYGIVGGRGCTGHCPGCGSACATYKEETRVG